MKATPPPLFTCFDAVKGGANLFIRGYDKKRRRVNALVPLQPRVFVPGRDASGWKTHRGAPLRPVVCRNSFEARKLAKCTPGAAGSFNFAAAAMRRYYDAEQDRCPAEWFKIGYLDIEVEIADTFPNPTNAENEITLITIVCSDGSVHSFGTVDADVDCGYQYFENERDMLHAFIDAYVALDLDIITGWNTNLFDVPYLINRIARVLSWEKALDLSPTREIRPRDVRIGHDSFKTYEIGGINHIDYMHMYKRLVFKQQESFSLSSIANIELGKDKLDNGPFGSLRGLQTGEANLYEKLPRDDPDAYVGDWIYHRTRLRAAISQDAQPTDITDIDSLDKIEKIRPEDWCALDAAIKKEARRRYVEYNIHDAKLIAELEDKLGYLSYVISISQMLRIRPADMFTTIGVWDVLIETKLEAQKIAVPLSKPIEEVENAASSSIIGGYVKAPQCGLHNWVATLDFTSLYPHIYILFNVSHDTHVPSHIIEKLIKTNSPAFAQLTDNEKKHLLSHLDMHLQTPESIEAHAYLQKTKLTRTANGVYFINNRTGFLPSIMSEMFDKRRRAQQAAAAAKSKKERARYHNEQFAIKIFLLNSGFGALASPYNRWYYYQFAEAATSTGQLLTRMVEKEVNIFMNARCGTQDTDYVIATDTDSVHVSLGRVSTVTDADSAYRFVRDELSPAIDAAIEKTTRALNCVPHAKLHMKLEGISSRAVWIAKKRYAARVVRDGDGKQVDYIKTLGVESVRSSTPRFIRERYEQALQLVLSDASTARELSEFIRETRALAPLQRPDQIFFPRTVSEVDKWRSVPQQRDSVSGWQDFQRCYYKKGTPAHVKAALAYNHLIEKLGISDRYEPIRDGQKVRYAYLYEPNEAGADAFAIPEDTIPPEMKSIVTRINWSRQIDAAFISPIKKLAETIQWSVSEEDTNFFEES